MARKISTIYTDNPSTTKSANDLSYIGKSPYGTGNDSAIKYSDELTQLNSAIQLPSSAKVTGLDTALADKASLANSNIFAGTKQTVNQLIIKGKQSNVLAIGAPTIPGVISAAILTGGIVTMDPGSDATMTFDSATNILAALPAGLTNNSTFYTRLINTSSTFKITLVPGADTLFNGMPSAIINPGQTFDLIGIFTSVSLPVLIFYGGTDLTTFVKTSADNIFTGDNTFSGSTAIKEIIGPPVFRNALASALTGSGTLTATQVVSQSILFNPDLDRTWIFPLGADIDSLLGTLSINEGFTLNLINQSDTKVVSFSENTGVSFSGLSETGTLVLSPLGVVQVILTKTDTDTFTLSGSSHGVFNVFPGDFRASGTVSGDGIAGNIADMNYPRFNEVSQNICIEKNYDTTSTIDPVDFTRLTIVSNSVGNISLTLPTGTDLQSQYSFWATDNYAIENIYFINLSATGTVTLVANTGFTIAGVPVPIIPVLGTKIVKARRVSANSYILYG